MASNLTESDGWKIAMGWRDELQGRVRLEITWESLPASIVCSFEWVTFVFDGPTAGAGLPSMEDPRTFAAYARVATTAWFALSCCHGFSGAENPQFWKRVFRELTVQTKLSGRPQRPITNALRFFPYAHKPFPQIKLVVGEADVATTAERIFLGRISHPNNVRDAKLQRFLSKLQPWIDMERWFRRVPVKVDTRAATKDKIAALLREITTDGAVITTPLASTATGVLTDFSQMQRIQSVAVNDCPVSAFGGLFAELPPCDVDVIVEARVDKFVNRHDMRRGLFPESACQSLPRLRLDELTMMQTNERGYSHLSVVCSALPHSQSITTIVLPTHRISSAIQRSIAPDWAWFGYAIFHPDAASQSGFTGLRVVINGITQGSITDLTKMSLGNNLLGGELTAYHEGHVRSSTVAWISPEDDGVGELYTFSLASWVCLCIRDASTLAEQDWICIVVPGFGSGWIHSSDITEFRSRPLGKSCLRTLRVHCGWRNQEHDVLINLLNALGDQLTSLHLESGTPLAKSTVHSIMRQCPSLKSFRLHHDGSFWADEELAIALPRLEELELTIDNCRTGPCGPLRELHPACVPHVKALRVISFHKDSYKLNHHVVSALLSNLPKLEYLHWSRVGNLPAAWTDPSGSSMAKATHEFLQQLPPASKVYHKPFQLPSKLAFLSVIQRNYVTQIAHEVASLIFQFASRTLPREIGIESARSFY